MERFSDFLSLTATGICLIIAVAALIVPSIAAVAAGIYAIVTGYVSSGLILIAYGVVFFFAISIGPAKGLLRMLKG